MTQQTYPVPEEGDYSSSFNHETDTNVNATQEDWASHLESTPNWVLTGVLIGLITVFIILVCYLTVPVLYPFFREKMPVPKERLRRRYETIEGWLISKKVRPHCKLCETIQSTLSTQKRLPKIQQTSSYDTAETVLEEDDDDDERACPICMESFEINDIVSWSPSIDCEHVFCHECIKEWLVHHDNCPYCRVTFLPVDSDGEENPASESSFNSTSVSTAKLSRPRSVQELKALANERSKRQQTTYYCIEEGLVTLSAPLGSENTVTKQLLSSGVKAGELASRRESRIAAGGRKEREEVAVNVVPNDETEDSSPGNTQALNFSNAVVDIEMCLLQLRSLQPGNENSTRSASLR